MGTFPKPIILQMGLVILAIGIRHIQSQTPPIKMHSDSTLKTTTPQRFNSTLKYPGITYSVESMEVETVMGEDTTLRLNYTVDCSLGPKDAYYFAAVPIGDAVVSIVKVKPRAVKDVLAACERVQGGAFSGNLEVLLRGDLPGRSQLYIDISTQGYSDVVKEPLQIALQNVSENEIDLNTSISYSTVVDPGISYAGVGNSTWAVLDEPFPAILRVICKKEQTSLDTAFQVFMVLFLLCLMVAMGCKTELRVLKEVWHKPVAPIIGLLCQFLLMPLIGFGLTMAAQFPSQTMALGFFACGCAPGGGASNFYTYLLHGDVTLSVAMTTVSNIVALGTFPLWIFSLGRLVLTDQSEVKMPYLNLVISLLMIAIPLSVGMALKHKCQRFTKRLLKVLIPATVLLIIALSIFGLYLNFYMLRLMSFRLVVVSFLLPNLGFLFGLILARCFKQSWKFSRTVAIETGVQNVGIAFILVMFSFSQPDNVLAAIPAVTSSMMTSIPLLIAAGVFQIYLRFYKNKNKDVPLAYNVQYTEDVTETSGLDHKEQELIWDKTVM